MADGSPQRGFPFRELAASRLRAGEIIVDLFAGGGGASEGLRQALGRDPDIAINHDEWAIGMHAANHPMTRHLRDDVWHADPVREVNGRAVGWFHASPDCTHFSQAKGGQPRSRATRSLSWVVLKWAGSLARAGHAPRIISLENVEQILKWGPLVAKRCKATGRVITLDQVTDPATGRKVFRVAECGERIPIDRQQLVPDKRHAGRTWAQFVGALRSIGYAVEWRSLVACDYGAGTSRKRLFLIARRDGVAITWPAPSHGKGPGLLPMVTAADCIDFTVPCPSIFTRKKPLAEATLRRVAKGIQRYVLGAAEPFIVGVGGRMGQSAERSVGQPFQTFTAKADACLAQPVLAPVVTEHANASNQRSWSADEPLRTQCANVKGGHFALVSAFLEQANTGVVGHDAREPMSTIIGSGSTQRLASASLITMRNNADGQPVTDPLGTICAGTVHHGVLEYTLSPEHEAGALRVAAFLINYYGNGQALDLVEPVDTITTRDRLALVTVVVKGTPYVIVDIGLRMLRREELFKAQGFPDDYIIDRTADGRVLSISRSVRMVGNSVSPLPLRALAEANLDAVHVQARAA